MFILSATLAPYQKEPADDGETNFGETPMPSRVIPKGQKLPEDMSPEERARTDAIDLRCLSLCIGMLERVNGVRSKLAFSF
jgi:condensin complex subunit 3